MRALDVGCEAKRDKCENMRQKVAMPTSGIDRSVVPWKRVMPVEGGKWAGDCAHVLDCGPDGQATSPRRSRGRGWSSAAGWERDLAFPAVQWRMRE